MPEEKDYIKHWQRRFIRVGMVVAVAPTIPLLAILITLKLWELAWPIIIALVVVLLLVVGYRLVRAWWWRWS